MLRASNCVTNLLGEDRDLFASRTKEAIKLPSQEDLDRIAEEEKAKQSTTTNTE